MIDLCVDVLPIVIGLMSDSGQDMDRKVRDCAKIVQQAQESFVKNDCCSALLSGTQKYSYSDPWYYVSEDFLKFRTRVGGSSRQITMS